MQHTTPKPPKTAQPDKPIGKTTTKVPDRATLLVPSTSRASAFGKKSGGEKTPSTPPSARIEIHQTQQTPNPTKTNNPVSPIPPDCAMETEFKTV